MVTTFRTSYSNLWLTAVGSLISGSKNFLLVTLALVMVMFSTSSFALSKLRDLSSVSGIRSNQLVGYGIVVGLDGTGDGSSSVFTTQSLTTALERMGITVNASDVKVSNVAAVMVTADLPPFAKQGSKVDLTVSSIGDANDLTGGTLLMTQLMGADGTVYVVAQGKIVSNGQKTMTSAVINAGGSVERELPYQMDKHEITFTFKNVGIENLVRAKNAINSFMGMSVANITSPVTVTVEVPTGYQDDFYDFLNTLENIEIEPENFAKVVVDQATGTVVMGSDVRISTVAVSHGDITISIGSNDDINQNVNPGNQDGNVFMLPEGVSVSDLVKALNAIGAKPADLVAILQSMKSAGALHAELLIN